jgi:hypothetical protein
MAYPHQTLSKIFYLVLELKYGVRRGVPYVFMSCNLCKACIKWLIKCIGMIAGEYYSSSILLAMLTLYANEII